MEASQTRVDLVDTLGHPPRIRNIVAIFEIQPITGVGVVAFVCDTCVSVSFQDHRGAREDELLLPVINWVLEDHLAVGGRTSTS